MDVRLLMHMATVTLKRSILLGVMALLPFAAHAQQMVSTNITATFPEAEFWVDGTMYTGSATLFWVSGTKHIVEVRNVDQAPGGTFLEKVSFVNYVDPAGLIKPGSSPVLPVTADASLTQLQVVFLRFYRVNIIIDDQALPYYDPFKYGFGDLTYPSDDLGTGKGFVMTSANECLHRSVWRWLPENSTLWFTAYAYPGYVFKGWDPHTGGPASSGTTFLLTGSVTINAKFGTGRRVYFQTSPQGLKVVVNRATVNTPGPGSECLSAPMPPSYPTPINPTSPGVGPSGPYPACSLIPQCDGEFDFLPGTQVLLSAPPSQEDLQWKLWTLDSWNVGGAADTLYTIPEGEGPLVIIAKFAPATRNNIFANPSFLKVSVNGNNSNPSFVYTFAVGSKQKISAPLEQSDIKGRRYRFLNWSNGGPADQEIEIPADGVSLMANYEVLGRLMVQTDPSGMTVQVGDSTCVTPCNYDRAAGTQVTLTAESGHIINEDARFEFSGWKGGGDAARSYTFGQDVGLVVANYRSMYRLRLTSDPADGVTWDVAPVSPDRFYPAATQVTVKATALSGFKFRRWDGALSGTYPMGWVTMSTPQQVIAKLDKVPHITPASVHNAAGVTPEPGVAPGSMIAIDGANLATTFARGPENPLAQTIGGVVVTLNDRILALQSVDPVQIIAQLPSDTPLGDANLTVQPPGQPATTAKIQVVRNNPGLFRRAETVLPIALAIREKGGLLAENNPADPGEILCFLATGVGPMSPKPLDGFKILPSLQYPILDPVDVLAMDQVWVPLTAAAYPGPIGWQQIRVRIGSDVPRGANLPITIRVNGQVSNTVLVPISQATAAEAAPPAEPQ
jgi:uncharacterized protein (TIGR03437 family)